MWKGKAIRCLHQLSVTCLPMIGKLLNNEGITYTMGFCKGGVKMNANLEGKTVIVTGADSGIGFAQAETLLLQGAVVFGIDINQGKMVNIKETFAKQFDFAVGSVKNKT